MEIPAGELTGESEFKPRVGKVISGALSFQSAHGTTTLPTYLQIIKVERLGPRMYRIAMVSADRRVYLLQKWFPRMGGFIVALSIFAMPIFRLPLTYLPFILAELILWYEYREPMVEWLQERLEQRSAVR